MKEANEIIQAVFEDNTSRIESLLNDHHPINGQDQHGRTPIYFAAPGSHAQNLLLERGCSFVISDINSPIIRAVEKQNISAVRTLLEKGASRGGRDLFGNTLLHIAVQKNNEDLIIALIEGLWSKQISDLLSLKNQYGLTSSLEMSDNDKVNKIIQAASEGNTLRIESLLNDHYPINGVDAESCTPFDFAFKTCNLSTLTFLMERGALPHSIQDISVINSLLIWAVKNEFISLVEVLLTAGVSRNNRDSFGNTPLHIAVEKGNHSLINALLDGLSSEERNDLLDLKNQYGLTPYPNMINDSETKISPTLKK